MLEVKVGLVFVVGDVIVDCGINVCNIYVSRLNRKDL